MHTVKTTMLTFIALVACLMLLLTPGPYQNQQPLGKSETIEKEILIRNNQPAQNDLERKQSVSIESMTIVQHKTIEEADNATAADLNNWVLILYPELGRIAQLENIPAEPAIAELVPMLASANPVVRLAALEALGDVQHPASLPVLTAALDDPDPQIRIVALEALAAQNNDSAVAGIEPYVFDRELEVRIAAIEALADYENEAAVPTLAALLTDQNSLIRLHAVNALGEIGGEQVISYLLQARYDPNENIRVNATAMLLETGFETTY